MTIDRNAWNIPWGSAPDQVGVSVVVPTLERSDYAMDTVRDLLEQNHPLYEILIVDQSDSPDEALASLAKQIGSIRYFPISSFKGLPEARNFAHSVAKYPVLLYVDDDIRCTPDLVSEHVHGLLQPGVGIVAGSIDNPYVAHRDNVDPPLFRPWRGEPTGAFAGSAPMDADHAPGGNFSTWKSIVDRVGGFDEQLNRGAALYEELEFCLRVREVGLRIRYVPTARLTHLAAPAGGCRVHDVHQYCRGVANNRALVMRRHLRWYQQPTAFGRLMANGCAFALRHRSPRVIVETLVGALDGVQSGKHLPHNRFHVSPKTP